MPQRQLVFEHDFEIAWGDMDALGHVNNAKYFDYFQEARILWLKSLDFSFSETGPILLSIDCTFLKPLVYPAKSKTYVYIHSLGNSSFNMDYEIKVGDALMAKGGSKIVWVNYKQEKSIPVPDDIRTHFN
jgi:acyl-CoA thioester hydrolase